MLYMLACEFSLADIFCALLFALQCGRACHHKSVFLIRFIAWESIKYTHIDVHWTLFHWYETAGLFLSLILFLYTAEQMFTTIYWGFVFDIWERIIFSRVCFSLSKADVWVCGNVLSQRQLDVLPQHHTHQARDARDKLALSVINILWRP
jgi:hypothetical protein